MADFYTVAKVGDIAEGQAKAYPVGEKIIAIFHQNNVYHAIDDTCPHMGASLSDGFVEGGIVTCSWHAWRFRLSDGAWADNPRVSIGCYPVRILGDSIQVQLEAPAPKT
jgi:nitrite reductase (NADH) small subunit/3-phenylpropionate/trans-cinnamate dioxygenase ferredoxin subunit